MRLRQRLELIFLLLLVVPFVAVTILQVDRNISVMVVDLERAGDLLIGQIFEQIRTDLNHSQADPIAALRTDAVLGRALGSSLAFGPGVVYARLETPDGQLISGSGIANTSKPRTFADLQREAASWWPSAPIAAVWGKRTYEMSHVVNLGGKPLAVIRIGLSTALIDTEARHAVNYTIAVGAAGVLLALAAAMLVSRLLREPIAALLSSAEEIAPAGDKLMLPPDEGDELESVVEKFNQLAARIKISRTQWETERGQFFNIFRSINDAVLLLDAAGAVLFANDEANEKLGLPAGGLAEGKPLKLLLGGDHPLIRAIETATATGIELRDAAIELTPDHTSERLLVSLFALGHGPEPPGILVVARDLKLMRELESVVEHSDRLVRLGSVISGVAHQLRNPLNAMNLQLELLGHDVERSGNAFRRVRALRDEIERLDRAIDALLRFMRPEQLKPASVPLNSLLTEVTGAVRKPEIHVECDLDPSVLAITADRALLAEALRNVVTNAVEAMPNGGRLTIASKRLADGFVEIRIGDEGPGIEDTSRIFNLYYTTKKGGSGLGLPLALRAVDLHRGTIRIDSQPGTGTTVKIRLPIATDHTITARREIA
ncbi:MAG: PAS domain-containing protein [Deltaproteobacteria bacterium]|nr:PAS domain-containing protein [Deltaproteobacteria bacterium]